MAYNKIKAPGFMAVRSKYDTCVLVCVCMKLHVCMLCVFACCVSTCMSAPDSM